MHAISHYRRNTTRQSFCQRLPSDTLPYIAVYTNHKLIINNVLACWSEIPLSWVQPMLHDKFKIFASPQLLCSGWRHSVLNLMYKWITATSCPRYMNYPNGGSFYISRLPLYLWTTNWPSCLWMKIHSIIRCHRGQNYNKNSIIANGIKTYQFKAVCRYDMGWITERKKQISKLVPWGTDGRLPLSGDFRSLIVE